MIYDFIIIGAGISGLYSAYKLLEKNRDLKILILEKNKIGGRMNVYNFYDSLVNIGAGVVRKKKDYLLVKLLNDLKIKYNESQFKVNYYENVNKINIKEIFSYLKKKYNKEIHHNLTFKKFAQSLLEKEKYKNFIINMGFSDFENEDAYETIHNYGYDDNISGNNIYSLNWRDLLDSLIKIIKLKNIKENECVEKILDGIVLTNKKEYKCKNIIIATNIETIKKLLSNEIIYNNIKGQTFLRTYGKFDEKSSEIMNKLINGYTIINGPLKKIIPINKNNGIYMIAYTDNKDAKYFKNEIKNKNFFCREIEKSLELEKNSLKLIGLKSFYWSIGTHYYKPLQSKFKSRQAFINKCQNPKKNIYVVGELLSLNQGWCQGALESVENIFSINLFGICI
jgi:hypothetical protein